MIDINNIFVMLPIFMVYPDLFIYFVYFYALFNLYLTYYFMNNLLREITVEQYTFWLMFYSGILYMCEINLGYTYPVAYYSFIFFYFLWCYLYL